MNGLIKIAKDGSSYLDVTITSFVMTVCPLCFQELNGSFVLPNSAPYGSLLSGNTK